ncbi:MAG: ubiquinol oxidase subunit II [Achromobacter sp.]|uniref:Ubiquinol oxidase subunit 2 n=1 Tax=Achromobacter insuavis TaxID=1287735 RepID=A0A6J5A7V8_9BURK|nr:MULTISPECIES: ubiquinol oxidase subunit II [Achromobacter]MBN9641898.1 ubiquinol oxidase subunit II [Achromobacter sp.]CAB3651473.1 Cytochrome bo(3) ubiquinol oxidase subunit 2 [Achromobacter insuavis]CAB3837723.1 Cytochrome bo(3) ubiquinol oxidase subunit 2 [Achromobacter insuavis]CUI44098.1 Ubiquinol oxidase subunit 2 precursor [Achromobacter sp. 2789STDY5608633]CUI48911.1 Ubiquinol oxidase subunit 2 precursor [Achromobacter sp. 2789STDY5608628]
MKHPLLATLTRIFGVGAVMLLGGCNMEILSPKGDIGAQEKTLLFTATGLMLIVVIPVIIMILTFAWKYRASNTKADYQPKWAHSTAIEVVVWTVPCIIVAILAVITWRSTHALDPYKPLVSEHKPVTIEVVSLDWKWLFIYPEYDIATVNEIAFPVDVPVNFRITSASVMNSFFIPQLGSQIYSMAGMETKLHLNAREPGTYAGISANYSGAGFSGMRFKAIATSQEGFDNWVKEAKASGASLTPAVYQELTKRSERNPVVKYASVPPSMFDYILGSTMSKMAGVDDATCTPTSNNLVAGLNQ